jgi:hypothetical protein
VVAGIRKDNAERNVELLGLRTGKDECNDEREKEGIKERTQSESPPTETF